MCRPARAECFNPKEVIAVHTICRVVRRCFLMGEDPLTHENFDHRKKWIQDRLAQQSAYFAIDLIGFAVMSNHIHQVVRSRPDIVEGLDDTEVARRWFMICPKRKDKQGQPREPNRRELDSIRNHPKRLEEVRTRLSDISWWMRLFCQNLAIHANFEEGIRGRFFEGRYYSVRLQDEEAILACSVYVDLNPIRAGIAETIEQSDFTSGMLRAQMVQKPNDPETLNSFLSPIELVDESAKTPPPTSKNKRRCSDKGVLPLSELEYLELLDLTARMQRENKKGFTPFDLPPILIRLGIDAKHWLTLTAHFSQIFSTIAGSKQTLAKTRTLVSGRECRINLDNIATRSAH